MIQVTKLKKREQNLTKEVTDRKCKELGIKSKEISDKLNRVQICSQILERFQKERMIIDNQISRTDSLSKQIIRQIEDQSYQRKQEIINFMDSITDYTQKIDNQGTFN